MPSQSEIIGDHPVAPNQFAAWLQCADIAVTETKCYRSLTNTIPVSDPQLIEWLARKLIQHHYEDERVEKLKQKYTELGFPQYAEQFRKLPRADKTRKGNAAETLLVEYVESCRNKEMIKVYKLRFNPNVDQSMKGDDMLMGEFVDGKKEKLKLFLGEAKFRSTPDRTVINEITEALAIDKKPLSFTFLVEQLQRDSSTKDLSESLEKFLLDDIKGQGNLMYTGLLLSNEKTFAVVDPYLTSDNKTFLFISIGIQDPAILIAEAFKRAEALVLAPTTI